MKNIKKNIAEYIDMAKYTTFILFILISVMSVCSCGQKNTSKKSSGLNIQLPQYPRTYNPYNGNDYYTATVSGYVLDSLLSVDEKTYKLLPLLAEKWVEKEDKKTYLFHLNKLARFSDETPVTATDVVFTFDTIYDTKISPLSQPTRDSIGPIASVKAIDKHTVEIKMEKVNFKNLRNLGGVSILPKHIYGEEGKVFGNDFNKSVWGSGPYIHRTNKSRKKVILEKNTNWWAKDMEHLKDYYRFPSITFKIISDEVIALETYKKKGLSYLNIRDKQYDIWDDLKNKLWAEKDIVRIDKVNDFPVSWYGVALNMRKAPFNEKPFRKALQLLLDREFLIEKIYKNKQQAVGSPFSKGSPYSSKPDAISYNPELAVKYLKEIGYTKSTDKQILYKELGEAGKKNKQLAEFTIYYAHPSHEKWLTPYKETASKYGIQINLIYLEWAQLVKILDDHSFDAVVLGWSGGGVIPSVQQLFKGSSANQKGSSNYPGLKNKKLDNLLNAVEKEFVKSKREKMYHQIEKIILDEQPYVWGLQSKYILTTYWKSKITPPNKIFLPYTSVTHSIFSRFTPTE